MPTSTTEPGLSADPPLVRRALLRFAVLAGLALLAVMVASVLYANHLSEDLAVQEATHRGDLFARTVSGPLVDEHLRRGEPASVAVFDRVMRNRLKDPSLVHIKVWQEDGALLWADQPQRPGLWLPREVRRAVRVSGAVGTMVSPDQPGEASELERERLLEVLARGTAADGRPVLVETYWTRGGLTQTESLLRPGLLLLSLGGLLVYAVPVLVLAASLARRVSQFRLHNERLLALSVAASERERRRIAADLHDGPLQEVGAAGFALGIARRRLTSDPASAEVMLDHATTAVQTVGRQLRAALVAIFPVDLSQGQLDAAVAPLAVELGQQGVLVDREVDDLARERLEVVQLAYQVVREGLRNVEKHAAARQARVRVRRDGDHLDVTIVDDGRGPGPAPGLAAETGHPREGWHFGLRLLRESLATVGGTLELRGAEAGGSVLHARIPRTLPEVERPQGWHQSVASWWAHLRRRPVTTPREKS